MLVDAQAQAQVQALVIARLVVVNPVAHHLEKEVVNQAAAARVLVGDLET